MKPTVPKNSPNVIDLECACANLRRASRIVTQRFDEELRPVGMRPTQFTILQALTRTKGISQGTLGAVLGLDSTTLTRTLLLLREKGWILPARGEDRREVRLSLTAKGATEFRRAEPYWRSAQRKLRAALGEADWQGIMQSTLRTAALAQER